MSVERGNEKARQSSVQSVSSEPVEERRMPWGKIIDWGAYIFLIALGLELLLVFTEDWQYLPAEIMDGLQFYLICIVVVLAPFGIFYKIRHDLLPKIENMKNALSKIRKR